MAGKNAYFRWIAIDKKLQTGKKYNWKMLADICESANGVIERPSERTIRSDIQFLKNSFGAPIPKRCPEGLWYYTDNTFSINNNPLFLRDLKILEQIKNILIQFPTTQLSEEIKTIINKVQNNLQAKPMSTPAVIQFQKNIQLDGIDFLEPIYNAILNQQSLDLDYLPFHKEKPSLITVFPYFLKQYNNRWFLLAFQTDKEKLRLYALDRIQNIKKSKITYESHNNLNVENYFDDIIGVSVPDDAKIETIILQASKQRTPYLVTKPIHPSQKITVLKSGESKIILEVIPNFELKQFILSHGEGIEVIAPEHLRLSIKEELIKLLNRYK